MPPVAVACDVDMDAAADDDALDALDADGDVLREIEAQSPACFRGCGPLSNELNTLLPSQISFPTESPNEFNFLNGYTVTLQRCATYYHKIKVTAEGHTEYDDDDYSNSNPTGLADALNGAAKPGSLSFW